MICLLFLDSKSLSAIRFLSPLLYDLLKEATVEEFKLIRPITDIIIQILQYMQNYTPHDLEVLPPQHKDREGSFPDLPKLTVRGTYALDRKRESVCSKIGKRQKNLLPGVFLVHCPHGMVSNYVQAMIYQYILLCAR